VIGVDRGAGLLRMLLSELGLMLRLVLGLMVRVVLGVVLSAQGHGRCGGGLVLVERPAAGIGWGCCIGRGWRA
jgi:hypothetical protein